MSSGVWLVLGVQASGKSTVADLLARSFERGVHVRGGQFYRWAVTGWVHIGKPVTPEAQRDVRLRYRLSSMVADEYCSAGFTVVVQDNIFEDEVTAWLGRVRSRPLHLVVLRPSIAVVAARDAARRESTGKVAYRPDGYTIEELDSGIGQTTRIGLWLDTSEQTPERTVDEILRRGAEAVVEPG